MIIPLDFTKQDTQETLREKLNKISDGLFIGAFKTGLWEIEIRKPKRTPQQNKSLHLYCTWLAVKFNDNHIPFVESYFGKEFEEEWTTDLVKRAIFHRYLKAKFDASGTSKATTKQLCDTIDYIETNLALKLKIDLKFPNREDLEFNKHINR